MNEYIYENQNENQNEKRNESPSPKECLNEEQNESRKDYFSESPDDSSDGSSDGSSERQVVDKLISRKWRISFAESCTGGMAAARLINVPDASKVIDASVVTYANEAKVKYASVNEKTIEAYGVVSEQVAGEMAEGIARNNGAQVGVGISGIAGPGGATATKPVGMVCFGFFINGVLKTYTQFFGNPGRNTVRKMSTDFVYSTLIDLL